MRPLEGTVAIVTGAGSGIGRAVARSLGNAGAAVALAARSLDRLETAAEDIRRRGALAMAVPCDVTFESQVVAMFDKVEAEPGPVGVLVNNAGTLSSALIEDTTLADWRHVLDVNLTGALLCMREAIRLDEAAQTGSHSQHRQHLGIGSASDDCLVCRIEGGSGRAQQDSCHRGTAPRDRDRVPPSGQCPDGDTP